MNAQIGGPARCEQRNDAIHKAFFVNDLGERQRLTTCSRDLGDVLNGLCCQRLAQRRVGIHKRTAG